MEKSRKTAPKTIQIKYPAPYSQSWANTETNVAAPAPSRRKIRVSSYSAQSWLNKEKNAVQVKPMRPVSSQQSQPPGKKRGKLGELGSPRRASVQFGLRPCRPPIRRLDPSAKHLKYGLFPPPRKPSVIGNLASTLTSKPAIKKRTAPAESIRSERRIMLKKESESPEPEDQSDVPKLVFRPISHRYMQQLSASNVYHMDIKPGRFPIGSPHLPKVTLVQH